MDLNLWTAFSALVVIPPLSPDTSDVGVVALVVMACGQWWWWSSNGPAELGTQMNVDQK